MRKSDIDTGNIFISITTNGTILIPKETARLHFKNMDRVSMKLSGIPTGSLIEFTRDPLGAYSIKSHSCFGGKVINRKSICQAILRLQKSDGTRRWNLISSYPLVFKHDETWK